MIHYINRVIYIIYYFLNVRQFHKLPFKAMVFFSVRVQGKKYISISKNSVIQRYGWLLALKIDNHEPELSIGKGCAIGDFCHITAVRKVQIENYVLMANHVYISDNLHAYQDINIPIIKQDVVFKSAVNIGTGTWIGENVCIIGASIGKNCVIGANSVVTKDIPDYCIAVGSPARIIKKFDHLQNSWVLVN